MKTFDYDQVAAVLAPFQARFEICAHGEGNACEVIDKHLECCAVVCAQVAQSCKDWALGVFSGELIFDPAANDKWQSELRRIHSQAVKVWQAGRKAEVPCWDLPGQSKLGAALWELQWLLDEWVTPALSAAPSSRVRPRPTDEQKSAARRQLSASICINSSSPV